MTNGRRQGAARVRAFLGALLVLSAIFVPAPAAAADVLGVSVVSPQPRTLLETQPATLATFTASATFTPALTSPLACWESSSDGVSWSLCSPAEQTTGTTLRLEATGGIDRTYFRAKFYEGDTLSRARSVYSDPALLRVVSAAVTPPAEGTAGTATPVTITGSGFSDGSTIVRFPRTGGDWTQGTVVVSPTGRSLTTTVPEDASAGQVTIELVSFEWTVPLAFTVRRPLAAPSITVTASATEFVAPATVSFDATTGGSPLPQVRWETRTDGSAWVEVGTGANHTRALTTADDERSFRAIASNGVAPEATSATFRLRVLSIGGVPPARALTTIRIAGTGFTNGMSVRFPGMATWVSAIYDTRQSFLVGVPAEATSGMLELSSGSLRATAPIFIETPSVTRQPTISDMSAGTPTSVSAEATGATSVAWRSSTDGTDYRAIAGATATTYGFTATDASDGVYLRAYFSSNGGSVSTDPVRIRVLSVGAISPASATTGTEVTIGGTGFVNPMQVRFGDSEWTAATNVTRTSMRARLPASATTGHVLVRSAGGSVVARSDAPFTVGRAPVLQQLVESVTDATGWVTLRMTATDHTSVTWSVLTPYGAIAVSDGTTYTFYATAESDGTRFVATATNGFGSVTEGTTIRFLSITSIDPTTATSGQPVTIHGTGFPASFTVTVGSSSYTATASDRTTATFMSSTTGTIAITLGGVTVTGPTLTYSAGDGGSVTDPGDGNSGPGTGGPGPGPGPGSGFTGGGVAGAVSGTNSLGLPNTGQAGKTLPLPAKTAGGSVIAYRTETSRVCIVMGTTLWLISVGTCTVTATPAGASAETVSLTVRPATPALTQRLVSGRAQATKGTLAVRRGAVVVSRLKTPLTLVGASVELWFTAPGKAAVKLATRQVSGAGEASFRIVATAARAGTYQWRFRGSSSYLASKSAAIVLRRR